MNITLERHPHCLATLHAQVPSEQVGKEKDGLLKYYSRQARLPGFRPGKAPKRVIEKRFAKELEQDLQDRLIREALQKAMEQEEIEILRDREPKGAKIQDDGTFSFQMEIVLNPDVALPDYNGIEVSVPAPADVTDKDVDDILSFYRDMHGAREEVTDRAAEIGDEVTVDYDGEVEGVGEVPEDLSKEEKEGLDYFLHSKDFPVGLGKEQEYLPGFGEQVEGISIGEEREVRIQFPDDFVMEFLQGKKVVYQVKAKKIVKRTPAELDDEFAGKIYPGKSLEELYELYREHIARERMNEHKNAIVEAILKKITEQVEVDLPEEIVTEETQGHVDDLVHTASQKGLSDDEIEARQEEFINVGAEKAQQSLKTTFILSKIAKAEKLQISQKELLDYIAVLAQREGTPQKTLLKKLQQNGRINSVYEQILLRKAIDFLVEQAKVDSGNTQEENPEPETANDE